MTHPDYARAVRHITPEAVTKTLMEMVDIASPTLTEVAYTPAPAPPTPAPTPAPAPGVAAPDLNLRTQYDPPPQPQPTPPSSDQNFQTQIDQPPQQPQQAQPPQWQSPQPQWQPPPAGPGSTPAGPMVTHLNDRGASSSDQPPPIPWMTGAGVSGSRASDGVILFLLRVWVAGPARPASPRGSSGTSRCCPARAGRAAAGRRC